MEVRLLYVDEKTQKIVRHFNFLDIPDLAGGTRKISFVSSFWTDLAQEKIVFVLCMGKKRHQDLLDISISL